ncbi:MAG: DoxX family protein [Gemmataceae bacterium]
MFNQFHNPSGRTYAEVEVLPGDRPRATTRPITDDWLIRYRPLERFWVGTGRTLLALIFVLSGISKIMDWSGTEAEMAQHGMVAIPIFLALAIAVEIVGGLSVFLGFLGRIGALMLFLYLIPVTLVFHNFWNYPPDQQKMQMINFLKNLAIMGGLGLMVCFGSGLCSIDELIRRRSIRSVTT